MSKKKKSKNNKILFICILIVCLIGGGIFASKKLSNSSENTSSAKTTSNNSTATLNRKNETYEASIFAAGDVMVHGPQLTAQYNSSTKSYDFTNNFKYVKKYIEKADYSLANLETTLAGNDVYEYSSYPMFNSPDELPDALKDAGFDLLSTINNHSYDKGDIGVERTLEVLKKKGFDTVGTREKESDSDYIVKDINNIKVGITSYSYGDIKDGTKYLNGIKVSDKSGAKMNVFDSSDVDKAFDTISATLNKMKDTDMQMVIIHWGVEYTREETDFQKQLAQKLCDEGVDIIIGSHPHVVEPVETIKSTDGKNECVVVYSLGNYISNQRRDNVGKYSEDGLMVNIDITKKSNEDEAKVKKVTCIPTWVNKYSKGSKDVYEIVPLADENDLDSMKNLSESKAEQSYDNTSSLVDTSNIIKVVADPFK